MTISDDYETKLNRMNRASQNVNLGTILKQADNVINSASPIDALQFNLNYSGTHGEGLMHWNSEDGVPEIGMPGGNVIQQIGTELLTKVVNKTGSLIPNGAVVYGNGSQGNRLTIAPAISSNNAIANSVIGMATEDIAHNDSGYVTLVGLVRDIPTNSFTEGQIVFLSSTNSGSLVATPPLSPNTVVGVGIVTVSSATEGVIAVSPRILSISASRIIVQDIDGYFDSTNVEDTLKEIAEGTYGGIYLHDSVSSITVPTGDTYTKVNTFTKNDFSNNVISDYANGKITISDRGFYDVHGSFSFMSSVANINILGTAFLGGVEQDQLHFRRKISTANDEGSASFYGKISASEVPVDLDFRVRHDGVSSASITFSYGNLGCTIVGK